VLRKLIDMQLVRVVRRSELPGRPWLFGTTQRFLEHFGINTIDDLPGSSELRRVLPTEGKKQSTETFPEMEKELAEEKTEAEATEDESVAALDEEIRDSEDIAEEGMEK
jgi:segregation and condensation protein B